MKTQGINYKIRPLSTAPAIRYDWIDIAKTIGIFLVIYGHGGLSQGFMDDFIYAFHIPLFFFLSGLLYKRRDLNTNVKRDTKRLLVPYLIINALLLLYMLLVQYLHHTLDAELILSYLGGIALGLGYNTEFFTPLSTPCWFIIALFLVRQLFSITGTSKRRIIPIAFLSALIAYFLSCYGIHTYIPIDSAMMGIPFFAAGYLAKEINYQGSGKKYRTIIIPGTIIAIFLVKWNGHVDTNTVCFGYNPLLYYASGILLTICTSEFCKILRGGG